MKKKVLSILALVLGLTIILGFIATVESAVIKNDEWIEDVENLRSELIKKHPNVYYKISKDSFDKQVEQLKKDIPNMNKDEIKVGMMKTVASIGDYHTDLHKESKTCFPIDAYWLKEDIYLLDAREEYKEAVYCKLVRINGRDIKDIKKELTSVVPYENQWGLNNGICKFISNPDVMYGLNIIPQKDSVDITFEKADGTQSTLNVQAVKRKTKLKNVSDSVDVNKLPLYKRNPKKNYWYEYLKEDKALYFNYSCCLNMKDKPFKDFVTEVFEFVDKNNVEKFVIDMRNNRGGNDGLIKELIRQLRKRDSINKKDKLYVITGRYNYSAAIVNLAQLREVTNATLIGENTAGKPDHFGAVDEFRLPNSKILVSYSTKYGELSKMFKCVSPSDESIIPDLLIENTIEDYKNSRDAVLESILK